MKLQWYMKSEKGLERNENGELLYSIRIHWLYMV